MHARRTDTWPPPCCAAPRPPPTPAASRTPTPWPARPGSTPSTPPRRRPPSSTAGAASPPPTTSGLGFSASPGCPTRPPPPARPPASIRRTMRRPRPASPPNATIRKTEALVAALPPALQADPGLALDRARSLRRTDHDAEAAALLIRTPDAGNLSAFWSERNLLARKLLHDGDPKTAYAVVIGARPDRRRSSVPRPSSWPASSRCACCTTRRPRRNISRSLAHSHAAITQATRALLAGADGGGGGEGSEAGVRKSRRLADHVLWPACRSSPWARPRPTGSPSCAIPPGPRTPRSPSPNTRCCAPPPGWSPGATRSALGSS